MVGVAGDGSVDVDVVQRYLGLRPAIAYEFLLHVREPLSTLAVAAGMGLNNPRVAWQALRRLWAASLVCPLPRSGRDAGERFAADMWEVGNAYPWRPSETHRRVLAALPASGQQVMLAKELAETLDLSRRSVNDLLYELSAARLAAEDDVVQRDDRRKRYAAWRRTDRGDLVIEAMH